MTADAPGSRSAVAPATLPWHRRLSLRTRLLHTIRGVGYTLRLPRGA